MTTAASEPLAIELSVHDVVALASTGTARPSGAPFARARLGQEAHTRYQKETSARPGFRKEVPVSKTAHAGGLQLHISGRIDVVIEEPGLVTIEEIKSVFLTAAEAARLTNADLENWANQARLYRWMWPESPEHPGLKVQAKLVLVSLLDDSLHTVELPDPPGGSGPQMDALLARAAASLRAGLERAEQRRALVPRLRFPFERYRPHQDELCGEAEKAVREGTVLAAEAPTGLGKTAAVLFGSLKAALETDRRVYFLTAKGTQQKMALETVERIRAASGLSPEDPLRIVQIRAKEKMCLNDVVVCDPDFCPYLKNYAERTATLGLLPKLLEAGVAGSERLLETGREHTLCPFELSLDLAWESEAVTCDYNYAFDPDVRLWDFADPDLASKAVVIVDEAHSLPQRARGYFSPQLAGGELGRLASGITDPEAAEPVRSRRSRTAASLFDSPLERLTKSPAARKLAAALMEAARLVASPETCGVPEPGTRGVYPAEPDPAPFDKLRFRLDRLFLDYLVEKRREGVSRPHDPAAEGYGLVSKFARTLSNAGPESPALWSPENGGQLSVHCLDPSKHLASVWSSVHAAVLMSGTLSPADYFGSLLGLPENAVRLSYPSPFPPENLAVEIDSSISTAWKDRAKSLLPLAHRLREFLERPGNRAVYAPSFDYLQSVHDTVGTIPGKRAFVQPDRMSENERKDVLDALAAGTGDVILWAVLGGIFAEGVDLPGEHLVGAAIIGPGLPKPSPEKELEKQYWDGRSEGDGFSYAYLYPGMIRVVQSAGRLIRSETDKGELLLIDKRFAQRGYRRLFPGWWRVDS